MAFQCPRFAGLLSHHSNSGYALRCIFSSIPLFQSSSSYASQNLNLESYSYPSNNFSDIDEHAIINELSDLLPISCKRSTSHSFRECNYRKEVETKVPDGFLLPEEKLRGVFLQKLRGKAAIESALTNVCINMNIDILSEVVNIGNLGGEAIFNFFNWAIKQSAIPKDIESYRVVIKALGRRKFFKYMLQVLQDVKVEGINLDLQTLSIVIDSYVRAHQVSKAVKIFNNLDDFGWICDTEALNVTLLCLCERSHVGAANSLFHSMKGKIAFNNITYNAIIGGWSKFGRVANVERILDTMMSDGFRPDCSTFNYVIEALGRAGRIDEAVEIFKNMEEKYCRPDTSTYNAMIFNFISIGDFNESMRYYKHMLSDNCDPNIDTYCRLIVAFLKAQKVADALEMFDEMLGRGVVPPTGTITTFIKPLCCYGPPHAAMVIYKKARKSGCRISFDAYKLLLMRLSKFGKCGMLLNTWEEMQECGYNSDMEVYEHIINGLCNIGQLENAALVMEESLQKGYCPSRLIYSKLSNKLLASNKSGSAYKLFLKVKDARREENARKYWRANGWHF